MSGDRCDFPIAVTDMPWKSRFFRGYIAVRDRMGKDSEAASHAESNILKRVAPDLLPKIYPTIDRLWNNLEKEVLTLYEEKNFSPGAKEVAWEICTGVLIGGSA